MERSKGQRPENIRANHTSSSGIEFEDRIKCGVHTEKRRRVQNHRSDENQPKGR